MIKFYTIMRYTEFHMIIEFHISWPAPLIVSLVKLESMEGWPREQVSEWNIFWDPVSTEWIFNNTSFPIILFPLDVTNQAKLAPLMPRLREKSLEFAYSKLAYEGYERTGDEPYYCMWNVVTSCYIPHPEFFGEPVRMNLGVVTEGNEQGDVVRKSSGREVEVVLSLKEPDQYYDHVLKQLAQ